MPLAGHDSVDLVSPARANRSMCCSLLHRDGRLHAGVHALACRGAADDLNIFPLFEGIAGHGRTCRRLGPVANDPRSGTRHCAPFAHLAGCRTRKRSIWESREWHNTSCIALAPRGNSYKVALYLNCAGLDWEPVGVDFAGGQTRDANWRAYTNAMGRGPRAGG